MRVAIDLDTETVIMGPSRREPVSSLSLKRGTSGLLEIQFSRDGIPVELPVGTTGRFGVKEVGKYDSEEFIIAASSWIKTGTDAATVYTFLLSTVTTELNALLGYNPPVTSNDKPSVTLMAEIQWITPASGLFVDPVIRKTQGALSLTVVNDVIRGDEGDPSPATPAYPLPGEIALIAPADGNYRIHTTEDGTFLQLWNTTQAAYQTISLAGAPGAETILISPAE